MSEPLKVLVVEDNEVDARLLIAELRSAGFDPLWERVENEPDLRRNLDPLPDVILSDFSLPEFDGASALRLVRGLGLDVPFIIVSGSIGEEVAVEAMRSGCTDYLLKDRLGRLGSAVHQALEQRRQRLESAAERMRLEAQLRQAQKMEAVGLLAGGVAHDFNNLLTIINGYSEAAMEELREGDPLRELIAEIQQAGASATNLTRQLLAFSRKQVLAAEILDLNQLIANLQRMLGRTIGEDIRLEFRPLENLWKTRVDPGSIEQVIVNLVVNARDAMPEGGQLTIETDNADLDEEYARVHQDAGVGEHVRLTVTDTGQGMDAATLSRIFEPFFTTKGPERGSGLGLATVYGIVKQSGGHIEVYTEPGIGSTFKIYLPRELGEPRAATPKPGPRSSPGGDETILVVEDEDSVRKLAVRILRMRGYKVLEAKHGAEALISAAEYDQPIDLLLTDVVMPFIGGRKLAEQMIPSRPGMKVLYVSGYSDDAVVRNGILTEGSLFLQKPYAVESLLRRVREVLDSTPSTCIPGN